MLFQLELPAEIKLKLNEAAIIQQTLFQWAASATVDTDDVMLAACEQRLQENTHIIGRADEIMAWITKGKDRKKALLAFAKDLRHLEKQTLYTRSVAEYNRYLVEPKGTLKPWSKSKGTVSAKGKTLLVLFYEEFRSKTGLPGVFFADSQKFDSQAYLQKLYALNPQELICSFCGEMIVSSVARGHVYTEIDHFFPKDLYPHLSIHPYNLIPACHRCNHGKSNSDPLKGTSKTRLRLEEVWTPYRPKGLIEQIWLEFELAPGSRPEFGKLLLRKRAEEPHAAASLAIFESVYEIPQRWKERVHLIGEKLFRRMSEFLRLSSAHYDKQFHKSVEPYLNELLSILGQEDIKREPYALPMLWWLAHMIVQELGSPDTAFCKELQCSLDIMITRAYERQDYAITIRECIPTKPAQTPD
jgi:hypothetical protein